ncbi:cation diffusion facilitator family transporter [Pseudidiomarina sp.]|uniref:cation efflux pump FieF n=1 Tax=Pseudidiomarina sp. TaxID=2081707 RepID=UPI00299E8E58|nr:cation diffusion facilitator family transporter [Pseudidiomarina sp.]MDX1706002.1 cation diffusion facilitator family transporter [Pseudidiomarina sp.]
MRKVLAKLNSENFQNRDYSFWVKLATRASVSVALTLILVKLAAWFMTDSASMLASLTDSILDSFASFFTFFAVRYAVVPADKEHRFGHGKAECMAALMQSALIIGSATLLLVHSVEQWVEGDPVQQPAIGVYVSLFAIVLTFGLVLVQRAAIRNTQSSAISADALHFKSDLLLNASVIAALLLSAYGWYWVDSLFAVLIALYLAFGAIRIGWDAFQSLMDRELPDDEKKRIIKTIKDTPGILGLHNLRTRGAGPTRFIQCHVELDDDLSLRAAHDIADHAERRVRDLFEDTDVIIHMDPASVVTSPSETTPAEPAAQADDSGRSR